jgi:hypothetical protein
VGRESRDELYQVMIQERRPRLERVRHSRDVHLDEEIRREVEGGIDGQTRIHGIDGFEIAKQLFNHPVFA